MSTVAVAALVTASPAGATTGGPDTFGYSFIDNLSPGGPTFSYQDISASGTAVVSGDDSGVTIGTPFPVRLYGTTLNSLAVTTNGVVSSTSINTTFGNSCLPTGTFGDNVLMVHWDDLVTTVTTQVFGTAPNRTFVIQWDGTYFPGVGAVSFNVTFTEGSQQILAQYQTVTGGGSSATLGLQQAAAASSLQYECNTGASVASGRAIRYTPSIGYYDMSTGNGQAYETGPITAIGDTGVSLNDVSAGSLANKAAVFVTNPDNSAYGAEYTNDLSAVTNYVQNGGLLVVHDRHVGPDQDRPPPDARAVLPGADTIGFFRQFFFQTSELDVDETNPMTQGPAGALTDASLDGGNFSSHGYALASTLPAGTVEPVFRPDPNQAVTFCYPFGAGHVIYSTIPLDFYLTGANPAAFRDIYAPNVLQWGLSGCPGTPIVQSGTTVSVTASTPTAVEGGAPGAFTFTRAGDTTQSLTVGYQVGGTATSGVDYDPMGTVMFAAGQSSVVKQVNALQDNIADPGETVNVVVTDGAGYTAAQPTQATVTISEGAPPQSACDAAPQSTYTDRGSFDVHAKNIDCITAYGFAEGFPDNTYRATLDTSRAQMASFVTRLLQASGVTLPSNPPDAYPGDDGSVHETAINQIAALGITDATTGQTGNKYNVSQPMRRDDMAQFLYNAYRVITGSDLPDGPDAFTDDNGNDNEQAINALEGAGVIQGFPDTTYRPADPVSRGQFASYFARFAQLIVDAGKLAPLS